MHYSSVADLAIYPGSSLHDLLDVMRGTELPDGALEHISRAMVRTKSEGPDPSVPSVLTIATKLRAQSFQLPKLVDVRACQTIIKVFVPRESGVLCGLEERLIVLMPEGTF